MRTKFSGLIRRLGWLIAAAGIAAMPVRACAQVSVNEVMANVKGSESRFGQYNEYVELLNYSDEPVDLSGWSISDGDSYDSIVPWAESLGTLKGNPVCDTWTVGPGMYCLILDRDYARAPDSSGYTPYEFASRTVIFTTMNSTIGNGLSTTDPIILLDQGGDTVSTYGTPWDQSDALPFDPGDGVSVERTFSTVSDSEPNWSGCVHVSGCTPGTQNSVTPYTGVGLSWEDISFTPDAPDPGEEVEIGATVHNRSLEAVRDISVTVYVDEDGDGHLSEGEGIETVFVESIDPMNGVREISVNWDLVPAGCHRIGVEVMDTVTASRMVRAGEGVGFLVANEIMYDPSTGGEWVEIHNWSSHDLNLRGWRLKDETKSCVIAQMDVNLASGEFAVICEDSSAFLSRYPTFESVLLEPEGFPALNNAGDSLVLSDISGFKMDCLYYMGEWGGGDGVSLERVNPTYFSDERSNWGGCVDRNGATPGKDNSIRTHARPAAMTLRLAPNPFSPDGDGHEDCTAISYELPFTVARVRAIVYDRRGRLVREILPGNRVASSGALLWDGRDDSGEPLSVGVYLVYLEARDLETQAGVSSRCTAVLARRLD